MTPAERLDVIVDFSAFPAGTEIVLRNDDPADATCCSERHEVRRAGPTGLHGPRSRRRCDRSRRSRKARRRSRAASASNASASPTRRAASSGLSARWTRRATSSASSGMTSPSCPQLGTTEIWQFENPSNMMHPMHIHLVRFQVLDRSPWSAARPMPLAPWEINTWKDTVKVPPDTQGAGHRPLRGLSGPFPVSLSHPRSRGPRDDAPVPHHQ